MSAVIERSKILSIEAAVGALAQIRLPVRNLFPQGMYVREMFIPAGVIIVGKIHKHEHFAYVSQGRISILGENGWKTLEAPCNMISPAGVKRVGYAHTDVTWTTVHLNPTGERNVDKLEDDIIAASYESLDEFLGIIS